MSPLNSAKLFPAPCAFDDTETPALYGYKHRVSSLKSQAINPPLENPKPVIETLLVTGGTGFIGGAVLADLYGTELWPRTLILVRASSFEEGRSRIVDSLARFLGGPRENISIDDRQIVLGDLQSAESLATDARIAQTTHVIHCAAVTSFSDEPRIRAINVVASLAFVGTLFRCARLKRFLNVGTAWCVGMREREVISEQSNVPPGVHAVPYTESKIEFERLVRETYPELPFVSARPSIVVGHTQHGTVPSGSIYWVFRTVQAMGQFTCSIDDVVDVVPVDWVASALITLISRRELSHDTYHLSAGLSSYSTVEQLDVAIAKGRNVAPSGRFGFRQVDNTQLSHAVVAHSHKFGDVKPRLLARALTLYGRFARSGVIFDNQRTLAEGIAPPPPFFTYADTCAATAENSSVAAQMEDDFK